MPKILKTKKQSKNQNKLIVCLLSVLKGFSVFVIGFLLISLLIYKVNDTLFYYYLLLVFLALGSFFAGFVSYKKLGGRGIICGLISAAVVTALLLLVILVLMKFQVTSRILLIIPITLVSGVVGGIISANK